MNNKGTFSSIDFGHPEAEHDRNALEHAFYEADSWKSIASGQGLPFVVGRKGSGKSAIAMRLELVANTDLRSCIIRFVPADFRHVEIRDLLTQLVNKHTSWQYIYRKVWEGILLGQVVRHIVGCPTHSPHGLSSDLQRELERFQTECAFYVSDLGDALSEILTQHVRDVAKKLDAVTQVELRKRIEPYNWISLVRALEQSFSVAAKRHAMFITIDGLDEHWDTSEGSLYFLAELLAVAKDFTAKFRNALRFVVCLRDSIFRALVDTRSIEYDKIESQIMHLQWDGPSLIKIIARRVAPHKRLDSALADLHAMLPASVQGHNLEDYIARYILQRPRDYINFFRMLQKETGSEPRAGEGHVQDAIAQYCSNRLVDLENEFGFTYPGISRCITALNALPDVFDKGLLLEHLGALCVRPSFRAEAPELMQNYGQPVILSRILLSIGAIGTYEPTTHSLRFVHEFSESRVTFLWEGASQLGIHPVYRYRRTVSHADASPEAVSAPAIVTHPSDYVAEKDTTEDLQSHAAIMARKREDLVASLPAIDPGQPHFRRFEQWVRDTLSTCFVSDLVDAHEQVSNADRSKRFEILFDIIGISPPWPEIKAKYRTHRLLVECKNTPEPSDADFSKLDRDMQALDLCVAFMAHRGTLREPTGKLLSHQRSIYINSMKQRLVVSLSEAFLLKCLKKPQSKSRKDLNALWRDHVQTWLTT